MSKFSQETFSEVHQIFHLGKCIDLDSLMHVITSTNIATGAVAFV